MKKFFLALAALAFASPSFAGQTIDGKQTTAAGTRSYKIYLPTHNTTGGLIVVLHGCFMTGDNMATGADFNTAAEKTGFAVLYPEQGYGDNTWKCWNWFKPENQQRDTGETSIIVEMVRTVVPKYDLNPSKVFVSGISAGSAMAANLLGCYSDVFAGGLLHSGLEFAAAQSEQEAHNVTKNGPTRDLDKSADQALACSPARTSPLRVIVVHGTADPYVGLANGTRTAELFAKINAKIFLANGGTRDQITERATRLQPGGNAYPADVTDTLLGGSLGVEKILVQQMGHGWSGGKPTAPYMEPRGVNVVEIASKAFFQ